MTQKELEQKVIDAEGRVAKREAVLKKHNSQLAKMIEKGDDRFDISIKREDIKSATSKLAEAREILKNWQDKAASQIAKLMQNGPTLMIAHNAQFDACFLRGLLRGQKVGRIDWLDSLTVYKDRRAYPHKLANAIIAYDLTGKVQNSHRAIDDVLALFEVLKAMDDEREDLGSYVNLFGYNPKYGVSGRRIVGVRYEPQSFSKGLTRPEQTLPARVARR